MTAIFTLALNSACTKTEVSTSNTNKAVATDTSPTTMPEGLSANQVTLTNGTTPGIPDPKSIDANANSKGATSIPGIPDTTKMGRTPIPKKTPPIPGIPDEETLRKQMTTPVSKEMMDRKPPEFESNSQNRPINKGQNVRKPKTNQ